MPELDQVAELQKLSRDIESEIARAEKQKPSKSEAEEEALENLVSNFDEVD